MKPKHSIWRWYSFAWVTLGFFLITLVGHWVFGWFAFADEQAAHGAEPELSEYFVEMPNTPVSHIHSTAPGPPEATAVATPTMLPVPIVAAKAVVNAPK